MNFEDEIVSLANDLVVVDGESGEMAFTLAVVVRVGCTLLVIEY